MMPTYCYKCDCGATKEVVRPMAKADDPELCDVDSKRMTRDYKTEMCGVKQTAGNWPMTSYAAGVHPDEVPAMREVDRKAGVKTDYTSDGDPVFTGRDHRSKYLQAHKMHDRSGGYGD